MRAVRPTSPARVPRVPALLALAVAATLSGCPQTETAAPVPPAQAALPPTAAPVPAAPLPDAQTLYRLVAPIALFPDRLVAQTLAASVYPVQVTQADQWLHDQAGLSPEARMQAANAQPWDPGVKALTQFPDVMDQLAGNLPWTTALGQAYAAEPGDVLDAVQVMRQRAQASGHLRDTAQQRVSVVRTEAVPAGTVATVVPPPPTTIIIEPAEPERVYVPRYDPDVVYGEPLYVHRVYGYRPPPAWSTGDLLATGVVSFGLGVLVGNGFHGGWGGPPPPPPPPWGWQAWGVAWHAPPGIPPYVAYRQQRFAPPPLVVQHIDSQRTTVQNIHYDLHGHATVINNNGTLVGAPPHFGAPAPGAAMAMPHFNRAMWQAGQPVHAPPAMSGMAQALPARFSAPRPAAPTPPVPAGERLAAFHGNPPPHVPMPAPRAFAINTPGPQQARMDMARAASMNGPGPGDDRHARHEAPASFAPMAASAGAPAPMPRWENARPAPPRAEPRPEQPMRMPPPAWASRQSERSFPARMPRPPQHGNDHAGNRPPPPHDNKRHHEHG